MKQELSAYEIVDAFPNEVSEHCQRCIGDLELKLILKRSKLRELELSKLDLGIKTLAVLMIEGLYPQELQIRLDKYKKCLELIKNKNRPDLLEDQASIRWAKAQPIESLYSFDKPRKQKTRILAICPFHQENTPSFVIYRDQNKFHCFGCGVKGDSIDFFMKLNKVSFKQALEALQ